MCIILFKPAGVELPATAVLDNCFENNPDGAGFMWADKSNGTVHIRKGFMTLPELLAGMMEIDNLDSLNVVVHFRIKTDGKVTVSNTHPFPVATDHKVLAAPRSRATVGIAHNGIIPLTSAYSDENSDTYYFVKDYASLICKESGYWKVPANLSLLERLADSKLCILGGDDHVEMIGSFEKSDDGCYYSNSSYKCKWNTYRYSNSSNSYVPAGTNGQLSLTSGSELSDRDKGYVSVDWIPLFGVSLYNEATQSYMEPGNDGRYFMIDNWGNIYEFKNDGLTYRYELSAWNDDGIGYLPPKDALVSIKVKEWNPRA